MCSADSNAKNSNILHCDICNIYYFAQINNFKNRFPNHTSTIRNYCHNKCDYEIAKHYNQAENLKFKIYILVIWTGLFS